MDLFVVPTAVKKELDAAGIKPALDGQKVGATFYRKADFNWAASLTAARSVESLPSDDEGVS
jgi:hypothetical protein